MAEIHAVLKRVEGETASQFRARCAEFVARSSFQSSAAAGRMTLQPGAAAAEMSWSQAMGGVLSAEACIVATYADHELDSRIYRMSEKNRHELAGAPVNPPMYPRMAHRMTLIEFSDAAKATMLVNHGRNWEISLDGKSLGFGDGSEVDAIVQVHEREVNNALYACCNDAPSMFVGAVLPAAHALQSHPQLARIFPRESALVGRGWTEREAKLAELQGWNLFETVCESGKRLEIQACDGQYLLEEDLDAWVLVMNGQDDIHILARTEIAHKAPLEYCKILRAVLEARPTPSARPRQTQSA